MTGLLRREGRADEEPTPPGRAPRMYRAVAVLAGFVLLCGAVTASTAALSGPRAQRAVPSTVAVEAITGAEALRPDLIGGSGKPPAGDDGDPGRTGAARDLPSTQDIPRSLPPEDPAAAGGTAPQPPATAPYPPDEYPPRDGGEPTSDPVTATVTRFYQTVTVQPREAFDLLGPHLQGAGYQEFRQSWTDVRQATVEDIRQEGPRAALVTVSLTRRDGSVLRILQRVLIIPGVQPRIADVALLSASRS
ncbi:MAG: hypothetical protein ABR608_07725 [Pseudonocardiaceae bacterium]